MTDEKICPILSGKTMTWDKDASQYNPRLIPCLREKCMAWVPKCPLVSEIGELPEQCWKYEGSDVKCHKNRRICDGYCKMIERR